MGLCCMYISQKCYFITSYYIPSINQQVFEKTTKSEKSPSTYRICAAHFLRLLDGSVEVPGTGFVWLSG